MISDYGELVIEASNRIGDGALVKRAGMIVGFAEDDLGKLLYDMPYIPRLEESGTNWLLETQPEIYLFAVIKHAYLAMLDAENAANADTYLQGIVRNFRNNEARLKFDGAGFHIMGETP